MESYSYASVEASCMVDTSLYKVDNMRSALFDAWGSGSFSVLQLDSVVQGWFPAVKNTMKLTQLTFRRTELGRNFTGFMIYQGK